MRRWLAWLVVSVVLVALLVWRTRPWEAVATGADWRLLAVVVTLNGAVIGAWAVRSAWLMAAVGHPLPALALVPVVCFANTVNNLTPASSGEALRAVILRRRHGVPYGRSGAVIIVERFGAIWIMALSAGAALVGTMVASNAAIVATAWLAAAAGIAAPFVAYRLGLRPLASFAQLLDPGTGGGRRSRLATLLRDIDDNLGENLASPSVALAFVASTGVVFVTSATQLWLILLALGQPVSPAVAWAALGTATVGGVISALPFGLGAADLLLTGILAAVGVPVASAAAAALLLRATVTLPLGLVGTASWIVLSRITEARSVADDA
jgi:hypothetical protein